MAAQLKAQLRNDMTKSSIKELRRSGRIPGIIYGKDMTNQSIHIDQTEFLQAIRENGKNSVFEVQVSGAEPMQVMIYEIQEQRLRNQLLHIDFKKINMNEPIFTTAPITLIGEAQGIRDGGVMQFQTREAEVRCMPNAIPDSLPLYVSDLTMGHSLTMADLELPQGVELQHELGEVICTITAPRLQPVEETEEDTIQEPEIVGARDSHGMDEAK